MMGGGSAFDRSMAKSQAKVLRELGRPRREPGSAAVPRAAREAPAPPPPASAADLHHAASCEQELALARASGSDDAIATALGNYGLELRGQQRLAEAKPLLVEALAIRRASLPSGHPLIATALGSLAVVLEAEISCRGRLEQAEPLHLEALEINRRALPAGHPDVATALNNLARLYKAQQRLPEAEPLFVEALAIKRASLPAGHPDLAFCLNNLARLWLDRQVYTRALPLIAEAADILDAIGGGHVHGGQRPHGASGAGWDGDGNENGNGGQRPHVHAAAFRACATETARLAQLGPNTAHERRGRLASCRVCGLNKSAACPGAGAGGILAFLDCTCGLAAYCCKEHQRADWKRHNAEEHKAWKAAAEKKGAGGKKNSRKGGGGRS